MSHSSEIFFYALKADPKKYSAFTILIAPVVQNPQL